jgi:hypothetical protein
MLWPGAKTVNEDSVFRAAALDGTYLTLRPVNLGVPDVEEMLKVLVLALERIVRGSFNSYKWC